MCLENGQNIVASGVVEAIEGAINILIHPKGLKLLPKPNSRPPPDMFSLSKINS